MKKEFFRDRRWNILFIAASLVGVVISVIRLKLALEGGDRFRIMLSLFWIAAFIVGGIQGYRAYRKAGGREPAGKSSADQL